MIKVETARSELDQEWTAKVTVNSAEEVLKTKVAVRDLVATIVYQVAKRYVSENYAELVGKLDQQAIANLVLADVAGQIATNLRWKMNGYPSREDK